MHQLAKVGTPYFDQAAARGTIVAQVSCSAEAMFECFEDADAWTQWAPLTSVQWDTPKPFGVGTRRTVKTGVMTVEEEFFEWEPGRRIAFYFDCCSLPLLDAFAEEYTVLPLGDARCEVVWRYAFDPRGSLRHFAPLAKRLFGMGGKHAFRKLERYMAKRTAGQA